MRQAVLVKPGTVEMRDVPAPRELKPNEILIKVHRVGVCGSDVHMFYGLHLLQILIQWCRDMNIVAK